MESNKQQHNKHTKSGVVNLAFTKTDSFSKSLYSIKYRQQVLQGKKKFYIYLLLITLGKKVRDSVKQNVRTQICFSTTNTQWNLRPNVFLALHYQASYTKTEGFLLPVTLETQIQNCQETRLKLKIHKASSSVLPHRLPTSLAQLTYLQDAPSHLTHSPSLPAFP